MSLSLKTQRSGGIVIITCNGRLVEGGESSELQQKIDALLDECPYVILDLTGIDFIDSSGLGLLVRLLRFTITPVAFVPTQIDYADYRELPGLGVKIPFERTLTQTYMQMTLQFTDVQPNVAIDAAKFAKPAPVKLQSEK